jgi:small nuclear ribonucleoprotein (snRNP)-like protein
MELNWKELIGKNVHIKLKNHYEYNGVIISIDDRTNGLIFIEILDKFKKKVIFTSGEIVFLEVK